MKKSYSQLDLFEFNESQDDAIHRLRIEQEKLRKSFFVRYNTVIKELDKIQAEIDWIESKTKSVDFELLPANARSS